MFSRVIESASLCCNICVHSCTSLLMLSLHVNNPHGSHRDIFDTAVVMGAVFLSLPVDHRVQLSFTQFCEKHTKNICVCVCSCVCV